MRGIWALIVVGLFVGGLAVEPAGSALAEAQPNDSVATAGGSGLAVYRARLDAAGMGALRPKVSMSTSWRR